MRRIIYLGGLGQGEQLSRHLASRQEVGRILRESGIPTIEFRASIVIGSGSLSFELVRALVEKLPAMVTPSWVDTPTQPIGIEDLVAYLVAALDLPAGESVVYEIGGPDRVSYGDLMREYGRLRGLRRVMVPRAPADAAALEPLAGAGLAGLRPGGTRADRRSAECDGGAGRPGTPRFQRAASRDSRGARPRAGQRGPGIRRDPLVRCALVPAGASRAGAESSSAPAGWTLGRLGWTCPPEQAFRPIARIGGDAGWYYGNRLWRLRGLLDLAVGGPGLRRGRRDPESLTAGRHAGLLAGGGDRARPPASARRRDAASGPGLAAVRGDAGERREPDPSDGALRPRRGRRACSTGTALWGIHQLVFAGMLRSIVGAAQALPHPSDAKDSSRRRSAA